MMRSAIPFVLGLALLCFGGGCGKSSEPAKKTESAQQKTYKVTTTEVQTFIEATGTVQADIQGSAKIVAHLAGTVSRVFVRAGDYVKKGDALLAVASPEITDTFSSYASAVTQMKQAERVYDLNKQLFEIGAVTRNDLLTSESNYQQFKAVSEGLRNKLSLYGSSVNQAGSDKQHERLDTQIIRSPLNGAVADVLIHIGDKVDTSGPLMIVADPKNSVIVANVYDSDVPKVKRGSKVIFYVDVFPDRPFKGVITYVSDISDADTKTVKTFIKLEQQDGLFKQNMFLRIKIEGEKRGLSIVPQTAMIYRDGKFYVYYLGQDKARTPHLKEIKPVKEVPGRLMAVEGIAGGDEIVLSAIEMERP